MRGSTTRIAIMALLRSVYTNTYIVLLRVQWRYVQRYHYVALLCSAISSIAARVDNYVSPTP